MNDKMLPRLFLVTLAALSLGGCVSGAGSQQAQVRASVTPVALSPQQVRDIQAGIRSTLKDPESARFNGSILAAKKSNGDIEACGLVNAKNSFGGYVGDSPFIATLRGKDVIDSATGSGDRAQFIVQICRDRGVPV